MKREGRVIAFIEKKGSRGIGLKLMIASLEKIKEGTTLPLFVFYPSSF